MSDDDLIRRGDALNAVREWTYCCDAEDAIAAIPAVTAPQGDDREALLWDLLEEIDARIDLADEISPKFADRVQVALWSDTAAQLAPYMTDLMVDPESIDAFLEANPLTPKSVDDSLAADPAAKPTLAEALTVPEVKALVEAANKHIAFMEGTGLTFDFLGKLRAALRQIGGEA